MKCFFDNNLGKNLALGLRGFGEETLHLTERYDEKTPDEVWLKDIGEEGYVLFTTDKRIRRRPLERQALKEYKVGAFFLGGKKMSRWNYIQQLIRAWHKIEDTVERETPPYAYRVNRSGTKLEKIALD
jgi:hypothetical protein